MGNRPLSERSVRFRGRLIEALQAQAVDRDRMTGICPACQGWIGIEFHGIAPRATLRCQYGCTSAEIIRAIWHR